eukprot:1359228-Pyramimonas_sp.AAC.1
MDYVIAPSIRDTSDLELLVGTSDSDWAGDPVSRGRSSVRAISWGLPYLAFLPFAGGRSSVGANGS